MQMRIAIIIQVHRYPRLLQHLQHHSTLHSTLHSTFSEPLQHLRSTHHNTLITYSVLMAPCSTPGAPTPVPWYGTYNGRSLVLPFKMIPEAPKRHPRCITGGYWTTSVLYVTCRSRADRELWMFHYHVSQNCT